MTDRNKQLIKIIEGIENQLRELKLEVSNTDIKPRKSKRLEVGQQVTINNPGKGQGNEGEIVKINYATRRATVQTNQGKISRIFSNLTRNNKQE